MAISGSLWSLEAAEPFRSLSPLDVAVRARLKGDGRLLCAGDGPDGAVALLAERQAAELDGRKQYVWNDAWECTPEMEGADGGAAVHGVDPSLSFLDKYLEGDADDDGED